MSHARRAHRVRSTLVVVAIGAGTWTGCNAILGIDNAPGPQAFVVNPGVGEAGPPRLRFMSPPERIRVARGYSRAVDIAIEHESIDVSSLAVSTVPPPGVVVSKAVISEDRKHVSLIVEATPDALIEADLAVTISARAAAADAGAESPTQTISLKVISGASGTLDTDFGRQGIAAINAESPDFVRLLVSGRRVFAAFTQQSATNRLTVVEFDERGNGKEVPFPLPPATRCYLEGTPPAVYIADAGPSFLSSCPEAGTYVVGVNDDITDAAITSVPTAATDYAFALGQVDRKLVVGVVNTAGTMFVSADGSAIPGTTSSSIPGLLAVGFARASAGLYVFADDRVALRMNDLGAAPGFGNSGLSLPTFADGDFISASPLPNGGLVVGLDDLQRDARIIAIQSDGTLAKSFGIDGVVTLAGANNVVVAADDKGRVFRSPYDPPPNPNPVRTLQRLTPTGAPDLSFGPTGVVSIPRDACIDFEVGIDADGMILVLCAELTAAVLRYWP